LSWSTPFDEWQFAVEMLINADGWLRMMANIAFLRAFNVFNPDRKDTRWGKRKLKRDE